VGRTRRWIQEAGRPDSSASRRRGREGGRRDRDPKQSGVNYSGGGGRNGGKNLSGELVDLEPEVVAGAAAEEVTPSLLGQSLQDLKWGGFLPPH
jgi:hypothetical protein